MSEIERLVAGKKGQSERRLMDDGISCSHFRGLSATVMPSSRNEILSEKYHRTESLMTKRKEQKRKFSSDEEKSSIHANLWIRPEKIQLRRSAESQMTSPSVAHLCLVFRGKGGDDGSKQT